MIILYIDLEEDLGKIKDSTMFIFTISVYNIVTITNLLIKHNYLNLDDQTFIKKESITSPPIARHNHTCVCKNNSMFIHGGWDGTKTLDDMFEFSLSN